MTFHLAAVEAPAHFRLSTNYSSCERSPLTPISDDHMHPPVFAKRIWSGEANSIQSPRNRIPEERLPERGCTEPEVTTGHAGVIDGAVAKDCARFRGGRQRAARPTDRQERKK
jgi:hypothetical protein